jgi:GMP synthase-like glutamine amidotransferase
LPSEEDLKTIKVLVFPGSARAVHDETNLFVPVVAAFIRKVMQEHSDIKLFGSCFGHQIFGHALGGSTEQMRDIPGWRQKIIGREHIKLTDAFFEMPYVKKYLDDAGLTKETFPPLVMQ